MDRITQEELKSLAARQATACISIYLPLEKSYPQTAQNPRLLKDLLERADGLLQQESGCDESRAKSLLAPARNLIEQRDFWQASDAQGLAVLIVADETSAPECRTYRLPYSVAASVDDGRRLRVAPLVRLLEWDDQFHLLTLGLKQVRLYVCDRQNITAAELPAGVVESFDVFVGGTEVGPPIQFRSSAAGGMGGDQVGLVHGQTSYKEHHKMRVAEFVSHVGKKCHEAFQASSTPLVLAAVDYLQPTFRKACRLDQLVPEAVTGSPDELSVQEMYNQALKLVDAWQERRVVDFEGTYENRLAHGRASHQLEMIVPAAEEGRIEKLVIGRELRVWGARKSADSGNGVSVHVERLPGDVDLLELAVRETLLHGGRLHSAEPDRLIEGAPAAAILRW